MSLHRKSPNSNFHKREAALKDKSSEKLATNNHLVASSTDDSEDIVRIQTTELRAVVKHILKRL